MVLAASVPSVTAVAAASVPVAKPLVVNAHNMKTQAKAGIRKPKVYVVSLKHKSVKEALSIPHWKQAMDEEYAALMRNKTWDLVKLPPQKSHS